MIHRSGARDGEFGCIDQGISFLGFAGFRICGGHGHDIDRDAFHDGEVHEFGHRFGSVFIACGDLDGVASSPQVFPIETEGSDGSFGCQQLRGNQVQGFVHRSQRFPIPYEFHAYAGLSGPIHLGEDGQIAWSLQNHPALGAGNTCLGWFRLWILCPGRYADSHAHQQGGEFSRQLVVVFHNALTPSFAKQRICSRHAISFFRK